MDSVVRSQRPRLAPATLRAARSEAKPYELRSDACPGLLLRVEPGGTQTFFVQVARGKRIKLGNAKILTLAQAIDQARRVLVDPVAYTKERHKAASLEQFVDDHYAPWCRAHRKDAEATLARLKAAFEKRFYRQPLNDITVATLERWRTDRLNSGTAKATVNRDMVTLSAVLSKAVEWQALDANPCRKLKPLPVAVSKVRFLSADEERRLRAALAARDIALREARDRGNAWRTARGLAPRPALGTYADHLTPMVLLSMNTGMRQNEVFTLRRADVDLPRRVVTVRGDVAKSGKLRHISLNSEAVTVLQTWGTEGKGLVFPGKEGKPLDNVKKAWAGVLDDAKIEDFRWHDLRHHFASRFVMAGGDLNTLRELLGHGSVAMVLRYAHLSQEHKAAAVERISGPQT